MKKLYITFDSNTFTNPATAGNYATDATGTTPRAVVRECMDSPACAVRVPAYYSHSTLWESIEYTQRERNAVAVLHNATGEAISDYGIYIANGCDVAFYRGQCIMNTTINATIHAPRASRIVRAGIVKDNAGAELCAHCGRGVYDSNIDTGANARRYLVLSDGRIVYVCGSCADRLQFDGNARATATAPRPYGVARRRACLVEIADSYPVHDGTFITRDILLRGAYRRCKRCGNYYPAEAINAHNGNCPTCARADGWRVCNECGAVYNISTAGATDTICAECNESFKYAKMVNHYHTSHRAGMSFFDTNGKITGVTDNFAGVGIELEFNANDGISEQCARAVIARAVDNAGLLTSERATLEEDGSVRGAELISAPHTLEAFHADFIPALKKVCDTIKGDKRIDPCNAHTGLHVHISRNVYGNDRHALARLLYFFATYADEFKGVADRVSDCQTEEYCAPLDGYITTFEGAERTAERDTFGTRYVAVNLENAYTIEFRLWQGKADAEWVRNCADMCYYLTERARDIEDIHANSAVEWFKYAPANVLQLARNAFNV